VKNDAYGSVANPVHQSGIGQFQRCPLRFKLERSGRQSRPKVLTQALTRGIVWHEYQHHINLRLLAENDGFPSEQIAADTPLDMAELLADAENSSGGRLNVQTNSRRESWIKRETVWAKKTALRLQQVLTVQQWQLLAAEQQFTLEDVSGPWGSRCFAGRIDALYCQEQNLHLVDYKTGSLDRILPLYLMERTPQIVIYGYALESGALGDYSDYHLDSAHLLSIRALEFNSRTGRSKGQLDHQVSWERMDIAGGMQEVMLMVEAIQQAQRQDVWPRNPTGEMFVCRGCEHEQHCADSHKVRMLKVPAVAPTDYY